MKVILLKNITKVGKIHDVKDVSSGYAMNFLIPRQFAELATEQKLQRLEKLKENQATGDKVKVEQLANNLKILTKTSVIIKRKANKQGHLFRGVHKEDIIKALVEQAHIELITPEMIVLDHPIKELGTVTVPVETQDSKTFFSLVVENKKI